jgi:hypothetical protein
MLRHLLFLFYKQMNVGQHKPVIEMNLGGDAIALAFPTLSIAFWRFVVCPWQWPETFSLRWTGLNTIEAFLAP